MLRFQLPTTTQGSSISLSTSFYLVVYSLYCCRINSLLPGCIVSNELICHYDHCVETTVAATCAYTHAIERSSRVVYQSILAFTSLANTCAGQSEHRSQPAPIRMPEWSSRQSGQRRILFIQPRDTHERERGLLISLLRLYGP